MKHGIYRLYDENLKLLYIGMSGRWGSRMSEHQADKTWWGEVSFVYYQKIGTEAATRAAEKAAILSEDPRYNELHNKATEETPHAFAWMQSTPIGDAIRLLIEQLAPRPSSIQEVLDRAADEISRLETQLHETVAERDLWRDAASQYRFELSRRIA